MNEIEKTQRIIVMKSGLIHKVSSETTEKFEATLAMGSGHKFIKLADLGSTINTAEVEGVYTMDRYADLVRIKQGEYQCEYQKWHKKKEECFCKQEAYRKHNEEMKRVKEERENRELTPEEQAQKVEMIRRGKEESALGGSAFFRNMFLESNQASAKIRRSTITRWEKINGKADLEGLEIEEDELLEAIK